MGGTCGCCPPKGAWLTLVSDLSGGLVYRAAGASVRARYTAHLAPAAVSGIQYDMSNRKRTRVISARMYTAQAEALKDAAAELGVPVAVLLAHIVDVWLTEQAREV